MPLTYDQAEDLLVEAMAEIERLEAELKKYKRSLDLASDGFIHRNAEIERLRAVIEAYQKLVVAYRWDGRTPEKALDIIADYRAAEAEKEKR